ncbi:PCF11, cleavage and polyadenylation factor subunit, homolog (Saccharomyces cerevisiae) [Seminavis robusta]|uniref:PCF11, cleavage and polyadenylation factor subunit, homolog (Saccharomyces cerevisiae) n=1 Tax=Seminavis robusta TaxID=568900 RepID=A0A9N8DER7_9STRA|nr:PCF11, cleavage and polyadenylation factor subunit, homolog (Saccharomyces cerevisiae) [Seminavis robusta]|eukprot:Sro59_g034190.1 PCF11, cleavage and polyadenylation factor subunit, homolog (Saccharomyces cerevisiae) (562) ;mRNA; f:66874-68852
MAAAVLPAAGGRETMDVDSIDDKEIAEYRELIEELGTFPDKVLINCLTMIAEDHSESKEAARRVYDCIREKLLSSSGDHKLPIMYVIDSILKNARGAYIGFFEQDAPKWMPSVYRALPDETRRNKLKKVWNTWKDFSLFAPDKWKAMGECFESDNTDGSTSPRSSSPLGGSNLVAGIPRSKTGALILTTSLRKEMQKILDEIQNDIDNELEKVSLERIADINPDLLANIKKAAEDTLRGNQQSTGVEGSGGDGGNDKDPVPLKPAFLAEMRSDQVVERSKAWAKVDAKPVELSNEMIQKLQTSVKESSSADARYFQSDAVDMTRVLAAASATATLLTTALERRETQDTKATQQAMQRSGGAAANAARSGYATVDKSLFTNNGIKTKNLALIGMLYEVGLPFVSSSDGRRFKTQLELSKHLDRLFKRSQIEKSMARTEERGWYCSDRVWTMEAKEEDIVDNNAALNANSATEATSTGEDDANPDSFTEVADETRDKCVVCGINFKMFFDNDDGAYKYRNCREVEVMNDDVAENESDMMLVHVTCWRGLGSPATLDIDQTLRD